MTHILPVELDSDFTSASSSVEIDGESDYVKSNENLLIILSNTSELRSHIQELQYIHKVTEVDPGEITQSMDLFAHPNELNPMEFADSENTPAEKHRDNGALLLHVTQPYSPYSPLTYALVSPYKPPLRPWVDSVDAAHQEIRSDHPNVHLNTFDVAIFGVYQDWMHQNPGNLLEGGIK